MTSNQERVLKALEKWEASQAAAGRHQCECCGNWSRGECECDVRPAVTLTMVVALAIVAGA